MERSAARSWLHRAIGSEHIADGAVTGAKLAKESVDGAKLTVGAVTGDKLADGAVSGAKLDLALSPMSIWLMVWSRTPTLRQIPWMARN